MCYQFYWLCSESLLAFLFILKFPNSHNNNNNTDLTSKRFFAIYFSSNITFFLKVTIKYIKDKKLVHLTLLNHQVKRCVDIVAQASLPWWSKKFFRCSTIVWTPYLLFAGGLEFLKNHRKGIKILSYLVFQWDDIV